MRGDLEARDADTWSPTAGLVATWIIRPASVAPALDAPVSLRIPAEAGGVVILHMLAGSGILPRQDGQSVIMNAGDTLTHSAALFGDPIDYSPDMRLIRFFVSARASLLRERTPAEIQRLEGLGPAIITRREIRPREDPRPINFLHRQTR